MGVRGLEKYGKKKWRRYVADVVERLIAALEPEDVVLGGGNVHKLKKLPPGCRAGDNTNAFRGGFRLWENADGSTRDKHHHASGRKADPFRSKARKNHEHESNHQTPPPTPGLEIAGRAQQTNQKAASAESSSRKTLGAASDLLPRPPGCFWTTQRTASLTTR